MSLLQELPGSSIRGAVAFGLGVFLHITLFRRGEWDLAIPKVVLIYFLTTVGAVTWCITQGEDTLINATKGVAWLECYHFIGIGLSMAIYRLYFHRLRSFPGPYLARLSNGYHTWLSAKNLSLYEEMQAIHQQYGDFVRIGPTELSITHPEAFDAFYSAKSPCTKGPFYNVLDPRTSLQMIRNKQEHARRRKAWNHGFSVKSLRDYEPRVKKYTDMLLAHIEETSGTPINVSTWFNFYSFDIMGDLSFGKSFGMLKNGVKHYFMTSLHADMTTIGYLSHLPWLIPFFKIIPILNAENKRFWGWVHAQVKERRQTNPDVPDVFTWILKDYESSIETKETKDNLDGDAYLIVVAGSDTSAATLSCSFFELAKDNTKVENLQVEVDEYFKTTTTVDHNTLSKLPYLDAVINETLRLHPPVPSGLQRVTPPEGLTVGGRYIPGNTIVQVPSHTLLRDERWFENAKEFIPERWTTRRELVKNEEIFNPFSIGPYSCVGKQLALMELRSVIAQIVHRFDVTLAPGQSEQAFLRGKRDTFTLALGPLNLVFTHRK